MSQSALDHTSPISDDVRWMCLPHVLLVCYLSCPDGIWQHHQRLCKALTSPSMPPVLHGAHTESKGLSCVQILLGGLSPASPPALVQGAQPHALQPQRGAAWQEVSGERQYQRLALAHLCVQLLIHCPETRVCH